MRKEELRGLIVYIIMVLGAIIVGFTVIRDQMELYAPTKMSGFTFILLVLAVSYLINVIGLEILHALGALFGGYEVTSINVQWICLFKTEKGWKLGIRDFSGISGQTIIAPRKEKLNPNLQSWFPLFGFVFEVAFCVLMSSMFKDSPKASWIVPASTILLLIGSMLALYNFVPIKLDCENDGYKIRLFTNPINVKAYNQTLEIQEKRRLGEEVKEIPVFEEITEYTAEINVIAMYKYLEEENFVEAEKIIDVLLNNKKFLDINDSNRLIAQKLYIALLTKEVDEAKELYEKICPTEIRRFIANDVSMPSIRAYVMIAGMIEGSESEVAFARSKVEKAKKRALKSEIAAEEKLLEKAIEHVYKAHPKWQKEKTAE